MRVKFTCVAFVEKSERLGVVGSTDSLGSWQPTSCKPLTAQAPISSKHVPTCFAAVIDVPELTEVSSTADGKGTRNFVIKGKIEYKFVKWTDSGVSNSTDDSIPSITSSRITGSPFEVETYNLTVTMSESSTAPMPDVDVVWEADGSSHNRKIVLTSASVHHDPFTHVLDLDRILQINSASTYALPVVNFVDPQPSATGFSSEFVHTTRYYDKVRENRWIHFNEVAPRILVGSCPRDPAQLTMLRDKYNVDVVFNFQAMEDVERNWIDEKTLPEDRRVATLHSIYAAASMRLVHIPTTDMCTQGRATMMAQAACLIALALASDSKRSVYVHCNAGVGRAVGAICAFLHFCIGLSIPHVEHIVRSRRTVAFFDETAIRAGKEDYDHKYVALNKVMSASNVFV